MNYRMKIFLCFAILINIINNKGMEKDEPKLVSIPLENMNLEALFTRYPNYFIQLSSTGGVPRFPSSETLMLSLEPKENSILVKNVEHGMKKEDYHESYNTLKKLFIFRRRMMKEQDEQGRSGLLYGLLEEAKEELIRQHAPKNEILVKILAAIHKIESIEVPDKMNNDRSLQWKKLSTPLISLKGIDKTKTQEGLIYFTCDENNNEGIIIQLVNYKPITNETEHKGYVFGSFLGQTQEYIKKGYIKSLLQRESEKILAPMQDSDGKVKFYTWIKSKQACDQSNSSYLADHYINYVKNFFGDRLIKIEVKTHKDKPNFDILSFEINNK